jgi:hypothetical protein
MALPFSPSQAMPMPMTATSMLSSATPNPDLAPVLDLLSQISGQSEPSRLYPPGYTKPKKPEIGKILSTAEAAKVANQPYLDQVANTFLRLRQQWSGVLTERDKLAREQGRQYTFRSTALVDAWNRFVAYLAARPLAFTVDVHDPTLYQDAQKIEDFAYYLRAQHERQHVRRGDMSLSQAEAKMLTIYGVLVSRRTLNVENPKCPIRATLIDPATVFPIYGKVGAEEDLAALYRVYTTSARQAIAEWVHGDVPKKVKDALGDRMESVGEDAAVDLVEYWDTWYCGTFILGTDVAIKPIVEHEYGCVPYVIQYGPGGEPMHTRAPGQSLNPYSDLFGSSGDGERVHKATGFLEPMKALHDFMEGVGARALDGFVKAFNPPMLIERTAEAIQTSEPPMIDTGEGGRTTTIANEEKVSPMNLTGPPQETNLLMTILGEDMKTNRLQGLQGMPDKSNISGTAQQRASEEGRELEAGWLEAMELFHGRSLTHDVKLVRNFFPEITHSSGRKKSFYIPRRNPGPTEERSFELTPEIVDNVDTDVNCSMNSLRLSELPVFAQAAQLLGPEGPTPIWTLRDIAQKAGVTDIDRVMAENQTYLSVKRATELPEFAKGVTVPEALEQAIAEAAGNPALQERLMRRLMWWEENIAAPQQQQMQMQGQPQPAGGPPQGPGGPPMDPGAGVPGGAGAPYAAIGMGPGSQGGAVGRPTGPSGAPPPPPPGSIRITP